MAISAPPPALTIGDLRTLSEVRVLARSGAARSIRLAAGLSLTELGAVVGVTGPAIYRWETGDRSPRGVAAIRYAEVLRGLTDRHRPATRAAAR